MKNKMINAIKKFTWEEEKKIIYCNKCNMESLHKTNNSPMNENMWKCLECGKIRMEYKYEELKERENG